MSDDTDKKRGSKLRRARMDAERIFRSALKGADAGRLVENQVRMEGETLHIGPEKIRLDRFDRLFIFGIGKAVAHMALPLEEILQDRITDGFLIVKYGYNTPLRRIKVREAGHPVPDTNGLHATEVLVRKIRACREDDLILFLISGGGSSLFVFPAEGLTLPEKACTTQLLLSCGATIEEVNTVRESLSAVKGGKLIPMAHPAFLVGLILSDVIGNRLESIASGPTVPGRERIEEARRILVRYGLTRRLPANVRKHLEDETEEKSPAAEKGPSTAVSRVRNILIGDNRTLLDHARKKAVSLGYETLIPTAELRGEAREEAIRLSSTAMDILKKGTPLRPPACLITGGETTVTVKNTGLGGRCQEFALATAIAVEGENIVVLAAGSDGTDGPTNAAGAIVDGETCQKGRRQGLDPRSFLERNDSYTFFRSLGDRIVTGPTRTNVMDLYLHLIP